MIVCKKTNQNILKYNLILCVMTKAIVAKYENVIFILLDELVDCWLIVDIGLMLNNVTFI